MPVELDAEHLLPLIIVNGREHRELSALDRGLAYGEGVFETIRVIQGVLPLWPWHYKRLQKGLKQLNIALEPERLFSQLDKSLSPLAAHRVDEWVLKLMVTRGTDSRGYMPLESQSQLLTIVSPMPQTDISQQGASLHLCRERLATPVSWAGLKTLNQLSYVIATEERRHSDYDEGILLATSGALMEATARNIFLVRSGILYTPDLSQCGVAGVMRQLIIDRIAPSLKLSVEQKTLSLDDVLQADEVFLSNSITGIWPVVGFEKKSWPVGVLTQKIQSAVEQLMVQLKSQKRGDYRSL